MLQSELYCEKNQNWLITKIGGDRRLVRNMWLEHSTTVVPHMGSRRGWQQAYSVEQSREHKPMGRSSDGSGYLFQTMLPTKAQMVTVLSLEGSLPTTKVQFVFIHNWPCIQNFANYFNARDFSLEYFIFSTSAIMSSFNNDSCTLWVPIFVILIIFYVVLCVFSSWIEIVLVDVQGKIM